MYTFNSLKRIIYLVNEEYKISIFNINYLWSEAKKIIIMICELKKNWRNEWFK